MFGVLVLHLGEQKNPPKKSNCYLTEYNFFRIQYLLEQNLRSLILTSGTLAPLKPLIIEMNMPNSIELENPHIVKPSQVFVKVVGYGPDNVLLDSSYKNR